jgi:fructuronate reductase
VVVDPKIIKPKEFIDEVIGVRLPNPFMPDTPQRIATDTSQKLSIRFGETIKAYDKDENLDVKDLKIIPLVLAGWLRYLMGINDRGETMELSSDPLLEELKSQLEEIKLGDREGYADKIKPILSDEKIFGVDLYSVGLGERVESYFGELIESEGAVEKTLRKYI